MIFGLTFLVLLYSVFIIASIISWLKLPQTKIPENYEPQTKISVLIAVRNEEKAIRKLLQDLATQTLPSELFEVIIIDDFSEDRTVEIIQEFGLKTALNLKVLRLENARGKGKKSALAFGQEKVSGNLIVQTDGDCRVQPNWLKLLVHFYETEKPKFISGPVCLEAGNSFFGRMQVVEFASLIVSGAATIGFQKPTMCNGANLAYEKAAFNEVNGFTGNELIASGDDEFLMHKIHEKFPGKVKFLKAPEATVFTSTQPTLSGFLAQRIRWASKWKFYNNIFGQLLAALIFVVNLGIFAGFFCWLADLIPGEVFWSVFVVKSAGDIVLLALILKFHNRLKLLWYWLPLQLVYIPYVVYCALAGLTGKYQWKGRNLQNVS